MATAQPVGIAPGVSLSNRIVSAAHGNARMSVATRIWMGFIGFLPIMLLKYKAAGAGLWQN
jgi:hypothetical protein